jgi:hypothetical protein
MGIVKCGNHKNRELRRNREVWWPDRCQTYRSIFPVSVSDIPKKIPSPKKAED